MLVKLGAHTHACMWIQLNCPEQIYTRQPCPCTLPLTKENVLPQSDLYEVKHKHGTLSFCVFQGRGNLFKQLDRLVQCIYRSYVSARCLHVHTKLSDRSLKHSIPTQFCLHPSCCILNNNSLCDLCDSQKWRLEQYRNLNSGKNVNWKSDHALSINNKIIIIVSICIYLIHDFFRTRQPLHCSQINNRELNLAVFPVQIISCGYITFGVAADARTNKRQLF